MYEEINLLSKVIC